MSIDHFTNATDMLAGLRNREISASELAEMHIDRIETHDGSLNAIPVKTFDRAREAARVADEQLAKGNTAPLLGLPMTLKESTLTAGLPQTAGIVDFKGYIPERDGKIASSVFDAGAGLLGKTNIPVALSDWQANSPVYGRTNNPWDLTRTPGGSTGGGGAALAAGLTPLEVGSDIGGSIRVPATYCGVYGHRPSETAIPKSGSFPMADLPNPAFLMGVQGPLARSANDLELLFDVLAGADVGEDTGWQLNLPAPRHDRLGAFRVAVVPSLLGLDPANSVSGRLGELTMMLRNHGATVEQVSLPMDMEAYHHDYVRMLYIMINMGTSADERNEEATRLRQMGDAVMDAMADGLEMNAADYLFLVTRREAARAAWHEFFKSWDVVVAPMTPDAAFPHQEGSQYDRTLTIDNREVPYFSNIIYPMLAIFSGLPSTAFPAGLNPQGLPIGLQAIGPYLEDKTTIRFAQLLEEAWHGFEAPPGY